MSTKYSNSSSSSSNVDTSFLSSDIKLTMWIPAEMAGKVIGKKGIIISNLAKEVSAKVINAMQPVGGSLWCAIVIMGDAVACKKAYDSIHDTVNGEVDNVVAEFSYNKNRHAYLQGTKGYNIIKKISADSNVRIFIPTQAHHSSSGVGDTTTTATVTSSLPMPPCTLEGVFVNVMNAIAMLNTAYQLHSKESSTAKSNSKGNNSSIVSGNVNRENSRETNHKKKGAPAPVPAVVDETAVVSSTTGTATNTTPTSPTATASVIEENIIIPSNVVGIILTSKKGTRNSVSILNQIQHITNTHISRVNPPPAKGSATATTSIGTADGATDKKDGTAQHPTDSIEMVPFHITAKSSEGLRIAVDAVNRMSKGERINDVLYSLQALKLSPSASFTGKTNKRNNSNNHKNSSRSAATDTAADAADTGPATTTVSSNKVEGAAAANVKTAVVLASEVDAVAGTKPKTSSRRRKTGPPAKQL